MTLADRVAQTSTATGDGASWNITGGAKVGHRTFGAGVGYGVTTYYAIVHQTSGEWEVGIGAVTSGSPDVLARTTVLSGSSGAGTRVNFSAGTKDVFVNLPAASVVTYDENGSAIVSKAASPTSNSGSLVLDEKTADSGASIALLRRSDSNIRNLVGAAPQGAGVFDLILGQDAAVWRRAQLRLNGLPKLATFDETGRMILDQEALDGEILALRSNDVAHGMTSLTSTDTYGALSKNSGIDGGVQLVGYSDSTIAGVLMRGRVTTPDTTKSTAALAAVMIAGQRKSGATVAPLGSDENILAVDAGGNTRFILDADGDSHQDVGSAWTNFDTHDDVALLNLLSAKVTRRNDPLRRSFGRFLRQNRATLERAGLVTFNRNGHHFVNMSRLTMLHTGALRQLGARLDRIAAALVHYGVDAKLLEAR